MAIETQSIHGLEGVLAALKSLPEEIVSTNKGVVQTALRKGAKLNVLLIEAADAEKPDHAATLTFALFKNIATVKDRHPEKSGANERYIVKVKKAPKVRNRTPAQYGRMLEFGSEKEQAHPWMTPAYYHRRQEALDTVVTELQKGVAKAIVKAEAIARSMP